MKFLQNFVSKPDMVDFFNSITDSAFKPLCAANKDVIKRQPCVLEFVWDTTIDNNYNVPLQFVSEYAGNDDDGDMPIPS